MLEYQLKKYKGDVNAIQDLQWIGTGITKKRDCTVMYSYHAMKHVYGTGFILSKGIKHIMINFKPVSQRLACLCLRGTFFNSCVINLHAPNEMSLEEEIDELHDVHERTYKNIPKNDVKLITEDTNANI
jgi:hypothetical protein